MPLTSDDLIQIGQGMKYQKTSEFVKQETLVATHEEPTPSGGFSVMTNVSLKRKTDETESDDGTHTGGDKAETEQSHEWFFAGAAAILADAETAPAAA